MREAISALKQSGRYDDMVDEAIAKHPPPTDAKPSKSKAVAKSERAPKRPRTLDERCANLFPNEHQFQAFREAVTTRAAQQAIPVDQQYALAKSIMQAPAKKEGASFQGATTKKQIGAPKIKLMVQTAVQEGLKKQRDIDKEERELYLAEQREDRIDAEVRCANTALRGFISALMKLSTIADEFPAHPKLGGFSAKLDTLVGDIQRFSKKLK